MSNQNYTIKNIRCKKEMSGPRQKANINKAKAVFDIMCNKTPQKYVMLIKKPKFSTTYSTVSYYFRSSLI